MSVGLLLFYADPGSGALLWQILAGSAVGLLFYIRRIVTWVKTRVGASGSSSRESG